MVVKNKSTILLKYSYIFTKQRNAGHANTTYRLFYCPTTCLLPPQVHIGIFQYLQCTFMTASFFFADGFEIAQ